MFIYYSDSFNVMYNHSQGLITVSCLKRLQCDDFKEGLVRALWYATKYNVKRWLLDVRQIGRFNEEEEIWLQDFLYPQLMSSLGANNLVAVLLSDACYYMLLLEAGKDGLQTYNSFITLSMFNSPNKASGWLKQNSLVSVTL